jgi:hypothetical protein
MVELFRIFHYQSTSVFFADSNPVNTTNCSFYNGCGDVVIIHAFLCHSDSNNIVLIAY